MDHSHWLKFLKGCVIWFGSAIWHNPMVVPSSSCLSITIENFKISPINPSDPICAQGGVRLLNLSLGMFYIIPKMLSSEFQSHSI